MMALINYRLKVTLTDGRSLVGQLLAFDSHMNLVLAQTDEFRTLKRAARKAAAAAAAAKPSAAAAADDDDDDEVSVPIPEQKRTLGLIILRGEGVVSLQVVAPPPADKLPVPPALNPGPGQGVPAGRGMGMPPMPAAAPPGMAGRPVPYGPPPGMMPPAGPPPGMPFGLPGRPPAGPPPGFPPPGFPQPGFPGCVFLPLHSPEKRLFVLVEVAD